MTVIIADLVSRFPEEFETITPAQIRPYLESAKIASGCFPGIKSLGKRKTAILYFTMYLYSLTNTELLPQKLKSAKSRYDEVEYATDNLVQGYMLTENPYGVVVKHILDSTPHSPIVF